MIAHGLPGGGGGGPTLKANLLRFLTTFVTRRDRIFTALLLLALTAVLSTFIIYRTDVVDSLHLHPERYQQQHKAPLDIPPPPGEKEKKKTDEEDASKDHFAYIFYATTYDYACSALINIDRLLHHPTIRTPHARIGIYLTTSLPPTSRAALFIPLFTSLAATTHGRVFLIRAAPPGNLINPLQHYRDVLLKLVPFDLGVRDVANTTLGAPRWAPWGKVGPQHVHRMVLLDADQLVMRNLDHLFRLPPVEIAAPRAYWGGGDDTPDAHAKPQGGTTTLLVVQPSAGLWARMQRALGGIREGEYDMDLVQRVFGNEALTLPGRYCVLNSHWEVGDVPFWFHAEEGGGGRVHAEEQISWEAEHGGNVSSGAEPWPMMGVNYTTPPMLAAAGGGAPGVPKGRPPPQSWAGDPGVGLLWDSEVVHFTALGKPWTFSVGEVWQERPRAHWLFAEMFGEWRAQARRLCPGWGGFYGEGEGGGEGEEVGEEVVGKA